MSTTKLNVPKWIQILNYIKLNPSRTITSISYEIKTTYCQVHKIIKILDSLKLIEFEIKDKRTKLVTLTELGEKNYNDIPSLIALGIKFNDQKENKRSEKNVAVNKKPEESKNLQSKNKKPSKSKKQKQKRKKQK